MTSKVKAKVSTAKRPVATKIVPKRKRTVSSGGSTSKVESNLSKTVKVVETKERAQRAGRTMTTKVSAKNQITIPVDILRRAGFNVGDIIHCSVNENGEIELTRSKKRIMTLLGAGNGIYDDFDWAKERADAWRE